MPNTYTSKNTSQLVVAIFITQIVCKQRAQYICSRNFVCLSVCLSITIGWTYQNTFPPSDSAIIIFFTPFSTTEF